MSDKDDLSQYPIDNDLLNGSLDQKILDGRVDFGMLMPDPDNLPDDFMVKMIQGEEDPWVYIIRVHMLSIYENAPIPPDLDAEYFASLVYVLMMAHKCDYFAGTVYGGKENWIGALQLGQAFVERDECTVVSAIDQHYKDGYVDVILRYNLPTLDKDVKIVRRLEMSPEQIALVEEKLNGGQ